MMRNVQFDLERNVEVLKEQVQLLEAHLEQAKSDLAAK